MGQNKNNPAPNLYIYRYINKQLLMLLHLTVLNILFKIELYIFEQWDEIIQF